MKIEGDRIHFSSGKTRGANFGIIGISPNLSLSEGYDAGLWSQNQAENDEDPPLTKEDLQELADYMIETWKRFRESVQHFQPAAESRWERTSKPRV